MIELQFTEFVRRPFTVEAVEVTEANIVEIAKHVGELKSKEDGTPYILVDRRLVPSVYRVFPGYWMTRMGDKIRCYSEKIFTDQFTGKNEMVARWSEYINAEEPLPSGVVDIPVSDTVPMPAFNITVNPHG